MTAPPRPNPARAEAIADNQSDTGSERTPRRLLLVDDDVALLRAIARVLAADFVVETATNAEQAAELLAQRDYDLIVTDYDMPGRNGIWLLELARRRLPGSRRVLMSGSRPHGVGVHLLGGLLHQFLEKPITPPALLAALTD